MKNKSNQSNSNGFVRKRSDHKKRTFRQEGREGTDDAGWIKRGQVWRSPKTNTKTGGRKPDDVERGGSHAKSDPSNAPGGYGHFSDIRAHRLGKSLRNDLYKVANGLPEDENHNLRQRIKHAATTVTSSLATGFGYGTYRGALNGALECRAALYGLQDHVDQLEQQQFIDPEGIANLKSAIDDTISAVNQYIGQLKRDQG